MFNRRDFLTAVSTPLLLGGGLSISPAWADHESKGVDVGPLNDKEDLFAYIRRLSGKFDIRQYQKLLGAANEFKDGDAIVEVAAVDERSRSRARTLLANTKIADLVEHPPWQDKLSQWNDGWTSKERLRPWNDRTIGQLKNHLLAASETEILGILPGLTSDLIACLVRLMSNDELIGLGKRIFHSLPGSKIGAKGYLGARIQPNSPTDHLDDIRFQVFDAFSYAVGDVLLGTNPVSSDPRSVAAVELALKDILKTFEIDHIIPHCVLAHIDVQAEVERVQPGSTEFWFQSIAGNDAANATFDISLDKMNRDKEPILPMVTAMDATWCFMSHANTGSHAVWLIQSPLRSRSRPIKPGCILTTSRALSGLRSSARANSWSVAVWKTSSWESCTD